MDGYSTKIKNSGEHLIRNEFPEKALELDTLVSSPMLSFSQVSKVRTEIQLPTADDIIAHLKHGKNIRSTDDHHNSTPEINTDNGCLIKKHKADSNDNPDSIQSSVYEFNGNVPSNRLISTLEDKLRPYILHFLDSVAIIKLWIQLMIPKVEDGNNFGVSIQEDSLAEVRTIETEVTQYIDLTCKYLISRGELIKKVVKYPHVEDYRRSVQSLDEKQFVSLRFIALELRNHYTSVHDLLMKNLEKIKTPRTNQTHSFLNVKPEVNHSEIDLIWSDCHLKENQHLYFYQFLREFGYSKRSVHYLNAKQNPPRRVLVHGAALNAIRSYWDKLRREFTELDPYRTGYLQSDEFDDILNQHCPSVNQEDLDMLQAWNRMNYVRFLKHHAPIPELIGLVDESSRNPLPTMNELSPRTTADRTVSNQVANKLRRKQQDSINNGSVLVKVFKDILNQYKCTLNDEEFYSLTSQIDTKMEETIDYNYFLQQYAKST
ncbi:unnamed protein product [Rotaria socialis]|uniref:EF-hand domain-containing protein n=2 Tax=Rotaria socialis TaxID=392032 RepID=A0A818YW69_9BILA|nr:unnamed protein product [Rotaria socialis]